MSSVKPLCKSTELNRCIALYYYYYHYYYFNIYRANSSKLELEVQVLRGGEHG